MTLKLDHRVEKLLHKSKATRTDFASFALRAFVAVVSALATLGRLLRLEL
jgi:hypothetical protein